jgi:hypothetical protein
VAQGFILLALIAGLVAFVVVRARRRLGLASTSRTWLVVMALAVLVVLALWASTRG